jgi:hypothetical protein
VRARALSALIIVPVVVLAFLAGAVGIALLVLVLAILGAREVEALLRGTGRPVIAGGVVAGGIALGLLAALPPMLVRPGFDPPVILAEIGSTARDLDGGLAVGLVVVTLAMIAFAGATRPTASLPGGHRVRALYVNLPARSILASRAPMVRPRTAGGQSAGGSWSWWRSSGASTQGHT